MLFKTVYCPITFELSKSNEQGRDMVTMQLVIKELENVIADSFKSPKHLTMLKAFGLEGYKVLQHCQELKW